MLRLQPHDSGMELVFKSTFVVRQIRKLPSHLSFVCGGGSDDRVKSGILTIITVDQHW